MGSFLSLFHCESFGSNRRYEENFQWFVVSKEEKGTRQIQEPELGSLIDIVRRDPSNHGTIMALARLLGASLEREAYDLFIDSIRPLEMEIFCDGAAVNADGFTDFEGTKNLNYRKYRLFKFVSFLDLLHPGSVRWRGQAELESVPFISEGLERFTDADLQGRTFMLSRWIQNPGPSAFSEERAKKSHAILERRSFLLTLHDLSAAEVAQRLDEVGFKPQKHESYTRWYFVSRKSFESWLSRERAEARRVWRRGKIPKPQQKLS
jgi:hypothetical protein